MKKLRSSLRRTNPIIRNSQPSRTRIRTRPPPIHFTVRTLLILTAFVALALSLYRWKIQARIRHNRAVEVIEAVGGYVEQERPEPDGPAAMISYYPLPPEYGTDIWVSFDSQVPIPAFEALPDLVRLRSLCFHEDTINDSCMPRIESLTGLVRLFLGGNDISDEGLRGLRRMDKLQWLDLSNTQVTDAGLPHLNDLSNLERLDLLDTFVTEQGVTQLSEALPDSCILWNGGLCRREPQ